MQSHEINCLFSFFNLGLAVIMPTPDQCSGLNSTMHTGEEKEIKSNQTESDKRLAAYVVHKVSYILMHCRNKVIQDLLEQKQKELSGSLLARYFYHCTYMCRHILLLLQ